MVGAMEAKTAGMSECRFSYLVITFKWLMRMNAYLTLQGVQRVSWKKLLLFFFSL